jgi:Holliday junction DNA helicase RuvA
MISRLRGKAAGRTADGLVLDVGGVGYLVAATPSALRSVDSAGGDSGGDVTVETYLHVREDALQLYGFADAAERELFTRLLGVSGIGPKVALAVVSSAPPGDLWRAIANRDAARFQAIPGIGKKTAERIVLELEGSIAAAKQPKGGGANLSGLVESEAQVELGYTVVEAPQALTDVDQGHPVTLTRLPAAASQARRA